MSTSKLSGILKVFSGGETTPEEQAQLAKEVMLMTLSRATSADSHINVSEVETVQRVLKSRCGEDFSAADIRVAASSELYEKATLNKYLASSAKKLALAELVAIAEALVEVVKADGHVGEREIEFFNSVVAALNLTPAELMGLRTDS